MSEQTSEITPQLLREWPLPEATGSKYDRGSVVIIGGAAKTPGAAQLAGLAALRVGAGHLSMAVAGSAAITLAVATPESGVIGLQENDRGSVVAGDLSGLADALPKVDAVLVGPGLDDIDETGKLIIQLVPMLGPETAVVLDAYALAALPDLGTALDPVRGRLTLTPNLAEGERLLGRKIDSVADVTAIAERYSAVVACRGMISEPGGRCWQLSTGDVGLATSGSGDVLAGATAGLLARGADGPQAVCWATHVHASAGDRLAARVGRLGFLARELLDELPAVMVELSS
jgi:ADP-dependent NAD(P)H-hydrate dehydratase